MTLGWAILLMLALVLLWAVVFVVVGRGVQHRRGVPVWDGMFRDDPAGESPEPEGV